MSYLFAWSLTAGCRSLYCNFPIETWLIFIYEGRGHKQAIWTPLLLLLLTVLESSSRNSSSFSCQNKIQWFFWWRKWLANNAV